jgi:adenosylcobinamide kinase/adenosylcobinamide-phosphate guanylyltransferase
VTCLVTAAAGDEEMAQRIAMHRACRPAAWAVVEEPLALAAALVRYTRPDHCVIVDCLTLWLSNTLFPATMPEPSNVDHDIFERERDALLTCVPTLPGRVIFVANEVGLGIVPLGAGTRRFCDEAGRLNQQLAALCERVTFMAAGLPLTLKPSGLA